MDTSVLSIVSIGLGITMMVVSLITVSYNKSKDEKATEKESHKIAADLAIQNTKLEIDIQYIKTQLASIQTMVTMYTNESKNIYNEIQKVKDRMYQLETNCKYVQSDKKKKKEE